MGAGPRLHPDGGSKSPERAPCRAGPLGAIITLAGAAGRVAGEKGRAAPLRRARGSAHNNPTAAAAVATAAAEAATEASRAAAPPAAPRLMMQQSPSELSSKHSGEGRQLLSQVLHSRQKQARTAERIHLCHCEGATRAAKALSESC